MYDKKQTDFGDLFESMFEDGGMEKSVYQDVLDNPKFQRWFRGSKVVDGKGNPIVLYHGTSAEIDEFDPKKGDHFGVHFGTYYQAENRMAANDKARSVGKALDQSDIPSYNVIPVFLKIKNILDMPDIGSWDSPADIGEELQQNGGKLDPEEIEKILKVWDDTADGDWEGARNRGLKELSSYVQEFYDGIRYKNTHESDSADPGDMSDKHKEAYSWIIFDSSQVKSAIANKGTYNDSKDMLERAMEVEHGTHGQEVEDAIRAEGFKLQPPRSPEYANWPPSVFVVQRGSKQTSTCFSRKINAIISDDAKILKEGTREFVVLAKGIKNPKTSGAPEVAHRALAQGYDVVMFKREDIGIAVLNTKVLMVE